MSACMKSSLPVTLMKLSSQINLTSSTFRVLYMLMRTLSNSGSQTKKVIRIRPGSMISHDLRFSAVFACDRTRIFCPLMAIPPSRKTCRSSRP